MCEEAKVKSSTCGDVLVVQARGMSLKVAFREQRRLLGNMVVLIAYGQVDLTCVVL